MSSVSDRLDWPQKWSTNVSRIGWALLALAAIALGIGSRSLFLFFPIVAAITCFAFARRMRNTPMLAVEGGELRCHISTGSGSATGGGQLFKTYGYQIADIDSVEEHLFPYGNDRARSKFVLKLKQQGAISRTLGGGEIWLIPQPLNEGVRDSMREFLTRNVPGGVTERVMDKAPWKK